MANNNLNRLMRDRGKYKEALCSGCDFYSIETQKCSNRMANIPDIQALALGRACCYYGRVNGMEIHFITPEFIETNDRIRYSKHSGIEELRLALQTKKDLDRFELR